MVSETLTFPAPAISPFVEAGVGRGELVTPQAVSLVSVRNPTLPMTALLCASAANAISITGAISLTGASECVFRGELVAINAVGLFTPVAPATANILRKRDRLQVSRICTGAVSTQVIELKSFWHGADELFVNQPVCQIFLISPAATAISSLEGRSSPNPAMSQLSIGDKFSQHLFKRPKLVWHSGKLFFPGCRAGDVCSVSRPLNLT